MAEVKQTQERVKRKLRTPAEQAEYFYNMKRLYQVLAISSLILVVCLVWMVIHDWNREWKVLQREFYEIEAERNMRELKLAEDELSEKKSELASLDKKIEAARKKLHDAKVIIDAGEGSRPYSYDDLMQVKAKIDAQHYKISMDKGFATAEWQSAQFFFREAEAALVKAQKEGGNVKEKQRLRDEEHKKFLEAEEKKAAISLEFERIDTIKRAVDGGIAELMKDIKGLEKEKEKLLKKKNDAEKKIRLFNEKAQAFSIRNLPGLDFFAPTFKIQQVFLENIKDDINFAKIPKVDRCTTCHLGIDNPAYQAEKVNKDGRVVYRFVEGTLRKLIEERYPSEIDRDRYTRLYMAHPNLGLFVAGTSPHPVEKFGCTVCHYGDGKETEFSRVVHIPENEEEEHRWKNIYNYKHRELWEHPMLPVKMLYASCRKCHTEQFNIDGGDSYVKGLRLFKKAGCYACHKTDQFPVLDKHFTRSSDGKIDELMRARRPGPPLTHVVDKLDPEFAYNWILSPRSFRPTTTMPHFFGQSNSRSITIGATTYTPQEVESVIAASLVEYIYSISQTRNYAPVPKGDPEKGRHIFNQVGCTACHGIDEKTYDPVGDLPYLREFAPNLAGIGTKFSYNVDKGRAWIVNWILDPKSYYPQTRMPSFRLSVQEAADIAEYLMTLKIDNEKRIAEWTPVIKGYKNNNWNPAWKSEAIPNIESSPSKRAIAEFLIDEQLRTKYTAVEAQRRAKELMLDPKGAMRFLGEKMVMNYGCYACHTLDDPKKQGMNAWTELEGIGVELTGAQPEGNKFVDRFDFGQTKYDGHNYFGISFKHSSNNVPYVQRGVERNDGVVRVKETRMDWIYNKLLDPRIYDGGLLTSKNPDELLKMPNFNFTEREAELLTQFVLSFTNERNLGLIDPVIKRMTASEAALDRGAEVIRDYNCKACHRFSADMLVIDRSVNPELPEHVKNIQLEGEIATGNKFLPYSGDLPRIPDVADDEFLQTARSLADTLAIVDNALKMGGIKLHKLDVAVESVDRLEAECQAESDAGKKSDMMKRIRNALETILTLPPVVERITEGSVFQKEGMIAGDKIVEVNGKEVSSVRALCNELADLPGRTTVAFKVERKNLVFSGKFVSPLLAFVEHVTDDPEEQELQALDRELNRLRITGITIRGQLVEKVAVGSPAEAAGFVPGTKIVSIGKKPTPDDAAMAAALSEFRGKETEFEMDNGRILKLKIPGDPRIRCFEIMNDYYKAKESDRAAMSKGDRHVIVNWTNDSRTFRKDPLQLLPPENGNWVKGPSASAIRYVIPQDGGDVIPYIADYKLNVLKLPLAMSNVENGDDMDVRMPPFLRTQGAKTEPRWLFNFLKSPYEIRPNLLLTPVQGTNEINIRMPTFPLTDEQARAIVDYFAAKDAVDLLDHDYSDEDLKRNAENIQWAENLVKTNCVTCHIFESMSPTGATKQAAPDLALTWKEMRPDWIFWWIQDPTAFKPQTIMPAVGDATPTKADVQKLGLPLVEDPSSLRARYTAIVQYLTSYPRIQRLKNRGEWPPAKKP